MLLHMESGAVRRLLPRLLIILRVLSNIEFESITSQLLA